MSSWEEEAIHRPLPSVSVPSNWHSSPVAQRKLS